MQSSGIFQDSDNYATDNLEFTVGPSFPRQKVACHLVAVRLGIVGCLLRRRLTTRNGQRETRQKRAQEEKHQHIRERKTTRVQEARHYRVTNFVFDCIKSYDAVRTVESPNGTIEKLANRASFSLRRLLHSLSVTHITCATVCLFCV